MYAKTPQNVALGTRVLLLEITFHFFKMKVSSFKPPCHQIDH